jgi:hypothetical protein
LAVVMAALAVVVSAAAANYPYPSELIYTKFD